jgi:hypothetical protein
VISEYATLMPGDEGVDVCGADGFDLAASFDLDGFLYLEVGEVPEGGQVLVSAAGGEGSECSGTGTVVIETGVSMLARITEGQGGLDAFGLWLFESVVKEDGAEHHPFIQLLRTFEVWLRQGSVIFEGEPPFVNVSGELNDDGSFYAEGRGTVAGFPDIAVTFEGQISNGTLTGDYTMGAEGGLPTGTPIVYGITGTYQGPEEDGQADTPETSALPEGITQTIDDFIQVFNQAFTEGDSTSLYQLLHPAVLDVYGEEACQAYLEAVVQNVVQIEQVQTSYEGPWDWVIDEVSTPLDHIYTVQVERTLLDQTDEVEIHLYMPGDDSVRWLTDCGDPLE